MSNLPNAERYGHISTTELVGLFDQGLSHRKIGKLLSMGPCAVGNRLKAAGKVRPTPAVSASQLKECRRDPAWEARQENHGIVPEDRIVCRECGELKRELGAFGDHSHLRKHRMTPKEYTSKYLGARLTSFAVSADKKRRQGSTKTARDLRDEFAANYLTPSERTECRKDPEWEEHHGITDFVACRICGFKYHSDLHLHLGHRHGFSIAAYHAKFPKTLTISLAVKRGYKRKHARDYGKRTRRLADTGKKIAAPLFLNERFMSNTPNTERYSHISTTQLVGLFDQGLSHRKIGKLLSMGPCAVGNRLRAAGKVRPTPAVSASQLKQCRRDPAWEARQENRGIVPEDRIVCRKCGALRSEINANGNHSHLRKHRMTPKEYTSKYLGARLTSFARSADQSRRQGSTKTARDLRDEFAANYLTPSERTECRKDPEWEEHHGINDFVACRICGFKYHSDLHLHLGHRHGLSIAAYHAKFPKTLTISLAVKRGYKRQAARKRDARLREQSALGKILNYTH
jgi:predicted transcriptional regulator